MSTVEDRLADALAARAHLETVAPEALAQRTEEVRAAVDEGVVTLDRRSDAARDGTWAAPFDEVAARRRRGTVGALAAAAAALLVAAAVLGGLRAAGGDDLPPATGGDFSSSVLRLPQTPDDVPPSAVAVPDGVVAGSLRRLVQGRALTAWIGVDERARACLIVALPDRERSASSCAEGEAAEGSGVTVSAADLGFTAVLVPDGAATATLVDRGLVPVVSELWVDGATAARVADADIRALSADSFAVEPFLGTGTADLPPLTAPGTYAVLLRCLPAYAVDVEVSVRGTQLQQPNGCGSSNQSDATVAALVDVESTSQTVAVEAPDGARWAVGVVRCTSVARQCPTVPGAVG